MSKKHKGLFIAFEGPDGSGKSTLVKMLCEYLQYTKNKEVVSTREPGGYGLAICEDIRNIILNKEYKEMTPMTEALLFAAGRAQHVQQLIIPSLEQGKIVVCDRYVYSSLVYQGYARGVGIKEVYELNKKAINNLFPDITFFIDVPYDVGIERMASSGRNLDRMDLESNNHHKKVCEGYDLIKKKYKDIIIINGNDSIDNVFNEIKKHIDKIY